MAMLYKKLFKISRKQKVLKKKEATTYKETLELYKNGLTVEEIAQKKIRIKYNYVPFS
jgi:ATP-dependent DNA helicase RecQ